MELHFLKTLVVIFGASAFVVFLLQKLKIPSIVGFLIAGAGLGPHGFGMIRQIREVGASCRGGSHSFALYPRALHQRTEDTLDRVPP